MTPHGSFLAALAALAVALPACGGYVPPPQHAETPPEVTARLRNGRVTPSRLEVTSGGRVTFVNDDRLPHQIYSSNCSELSSKVLDPGQSAASVVGRGPRTCKFQDLLAPTAVEYWGTVTVAAPAESATAASAPAAAGR